MPLPPPTPAHKLTASQSLAHIPMWDSSDPRRNPAPLPPIPKTGESSRTNSFDDGAGSREVSPIRRTRDDSVPGPLQPSPARNPTITTPILAHKRANSTQPSPSVREMQNLIMNGGHNSPSRNGTPGAPSPRDLFGSNTHFPSRSRDHRESFSKEPSYNSADYRKSLDFERTSNLPPLPPPRTITAPAAPEVTPTPSPERPDRDLAVTRTPEVNHTPARLGPVDFSTISSQLSGLTAIASNLQREMANLSRRSKDNATDLISLKEATKNRDEDIRRSLREMAHNLGPGDVSQKLLEHARSIPLATNRSASSSGSSSYASDAGDLADGGKISVARSSTRVLDKIAHEMLTKADQERTIEILNDIKETLRPGVGRSEAEEQILSILEEIKDREDARGKELVISGSRHDRGSFDETNERIMSALEELREEILEEKSGSGEEKIMSMLEELRHKEGPTATDDDRIIEILERLKDRDEDDRPDTIIAMLEELKAREGSEKLASMIEEVKQGIDGLAQDLHQRVSSALALSPTASREQEDATGLPPNPAMPVEQILRDLQDVKDAVENKEEAEKDVKDLLDDWKVQWASREKEVGQALKDLANQLEILATEQRTSMARLPYLGSPREHSQALTTTNPPLPPDLDNEAAITALANIASTTTRTDITLSSINALIKVFQKETQSINNNNAEVLSGMGRFLDELGHAVAGNSGQYQDVRKVLEVVRSGVGSGNDRLASFEIANKTRMEEILYLQKHLQKTIMGAEDEVLWKRDVGVKDDVEELRDRIEDIVRSTTDASRKLTEKTIQAINDSNPREDIAELKSALGAMAQRSLEAFQKADSHAVIEELRELIEQMLEKQNEAAGSTVTGDAIAELRSEFKEMLQRSISLAETLEAKDDSAIVQEMLAGLKQELASHMEASASTTANESAAVKSSLEDFKTELAKMIEESLTTAVAAASADDKTAAALAELKIEVNSTLSQAMALSDKPDDAEKLLEPIAQLRQEVQDLVEKSMSALAVPTTYPEAEEIKARLEKLSMEVTEAVERSSIVANDSLTSSVDTSVEVKLALEGLQKDITEMGVSIATLANNPNSAAEESLSNAFDAMKHEVLRKMETSLQVSDRAVSATAEVSEQTKEAIEQLKGELKGLFAAGNASKELAPVSVQLPDSHLEDTLESFKKDISEAIEKSLGKIDGVQEVKELVEGLRAEVSQMMEKHASMMAPLPTATDPAFKDSLERLRGDIAGIVEKMSTLPADSASEDSKALRAEVHEMMERTNTMIAPVASPFSAGSSDKLEELFTTLKDDMNEMVERSLAAAIANCTFDSEENVKDAMEDLKRELKDIVDKSMMPAPQHREDTSILLREAIDVLRQDIAIMLEKKSRGEDEDRDEIRSKLEGLKSQFGELLERSSSVEIKEAVERLTVQFEELPEKMLNADLKALLETMKGELSGSSHPSDIKDSIDALKAEVQNLARVPSDGVTKEMVEDLKVHISGLADKSVPTDNKAVIDSLKLQLEGLIDKPGDDSTKDSLLALTALVEVLAEKSKDDELQDAIELLRTDVQSMTEKLPATSSNVGLDSSALESFKKEILGALEQLKSDLADPVPKSRTVSQLGVADTNKSDDVKDAFETIKNDIRKLAAGGVLPVVSSSGDGDAVTVLPDAADMKEAIADVGSAVGEARVEIAVLNELLKDRNNEAREATTDLALQTKKAQDETSGGLSGIKTAVERFEADARARLEDISTTVTEFQGQTSKGVLTLMEAVSGVREETREGLEEVNKTVEGAQVELKEVVSGVEVKLDHGNSQTQEAIAAVKGSVDEARNDAGEKFSTLSAAVTASQETVSGNVAAVKTTLDDSHASNVTEHQKTQKQVDEVLTRVDGFQTEWKDGQPTLFNAMLEMKNLFLEAQKVIAKKEDIETINIPSPPPTYDDSQTQEKLDKLLAENSDTSKHLTQLDMLDAIQKQVVATSADITDFLKIQKAAINDDVATKTKAARQAELESERAISEKRVVEAATHRLRNEHDKLQATVEALTEETEDLHSAKLRLTQEVSGLETALRLRREELMMLEARGEALERRMLEGVIEQSRALLSKPKGRSARRTTELRPQASQATLGGSGKRIRSLNQIANEHTAGNPGRTSSSGVGSLGLGQKEFSPSLGLLNRSQSVKQTSYTGGGSAVGRTASQKRIPSDRKENHPYGSAGSGDDVAERGYAEDDVLTEEADEGDDDVASVMRLPSEEAEDVDPDESLRRKSKKYPALGLDFSRRESTESVGSVSDTSSVS